MDSQPNTDTATCLHAAYESAGGSEGVFSCRAADYAAARPDYPEALYEMLRTACGPARGSVIADVGAGTGLLTQGLLQQGFSVIAVEPNPAMRRIADQWLGRQAAYRSTAGTAESMPLETASIDLITAAQAFHWFDVERARAECLRVLQPAGMVALIWNDRVLTDPLHLALDEIFAEFGGERRNALAAHEQHRDVQGFFGSVTPRQGQWPHTHLVDETGLLSLVFSRSYMPERSDATGRQAAEKTRRLFRRMASAGRIALRYTTTAFVGRPQQY